MAAYKKTLKDVVSLWSSSMRAASFWFPWFKEPGRRKARRRYCLWPITGPRSPRSAVSAFRRTKDDSDFTSGFMIRTSVFPKSFPSSNTCCGILRRASSLFGTKEPLTEPKRSKSFWLNIRAFGLTTSRGILPNLIPRNFAGAISSAPWPTALQKITSILNVFSKLRCASLSAREKYSDRMSGLRNCHGTRGCTILFT